ncbi:xyloglucan galactosyltransferase XLT2-like [Lolium rigidum]|uniref:xyloglucan galactosyltransferase XLT2-like n=1 Tax=Lolium rigidum TaxID=89674 RepID=UPI001F5E1CDE|nr:xyloglucan galactosyltransferase XLT2-like [Lolium rigidum]
MPESPTSPAKPPSPPGSPVNAATPYAASVLLRAAVVLLAFLALQLVLFKSLLKFPSTRFLPAPGRCNSTWANGPVEAGACKAGLIYVYDLPPEFNHELVGDCKRLWPWYSFCPYLSNGGLGRPCSTVPAFSGVVPNASLPNWYNTDQFPLEIIIHRRILAHRCRTTDPSLATVLYVPFYAGLDVGSHLWGLNATVADRDRAGTRLLRWLTNQTSFQKSGGWDHFMTLGRITWDFRRYSDDGWGSNFVLMPGMGNVTRLVIESDRQDPMDVGVPYPTGFHPRTAADVRAWQRHVLSRNRTNLFGFAGAPRYGFRNDFRDVLLDECEDAGHAYCRSVDCRGQRCNNDTAALTKLFLDSKFCLQPRGDSYTRRSLFDCMVAGAVPVLFWRRTAYDQYRWFLPAGQRGKEGEWSVFMDRRALSAGNVSVLEFLQGFSEQRVRRMRERVVEMIPRLVYSSSPHGLGDGMADAFEVALDGVFKRFRRRRWSSEREGPPPGPSVAVRVNGTSLAPPTSNGRNRSVIRRRRRRHVSRDRSRRVVSSHIRSVISQGPASGRQNVQTS